MINYLLVMSDVLNQQIFTFQYGSAWFQPQSACLQVEDLRVNNQNLNV